MRARGRRRSRARIRDVCLAIFEVAARRVEAAGLVLADTKFELGLDRRRARPVRRGGDARLLEALAERTGSSAATVPPAFDKQPFRDWLAAQPWDRTPPPPRVPDDVVDATSRRYVAAYERVTGRSLDDWYGHAP